ncbi:MAG: TonB-dependent receptor [Bacteroidota bacterium]
MKTRIVFALFLLGISHQFVFTQHEIQGQIIDLESSAIPYANVLLLHAVDSSYVLGQLSDEDGTFNMVVPETGRYLISASLIGYQTVYTDPFDLTEATYKLPAILLPASGLDLNTVEVRAEKPLIVRRLDRTIVNLENRPAVAGRSVLELMEQLPGVVVNRTNNTISMLGKDGVNLLINNRQQYLTGDALFNYLQGINTDNVSSIELITTPPAEFDAQGNAGFINLVLKSSPGDGFQGGYSLFAAYGNGRQGGGNFNFNYRKERLNLFGSYAYAHDGQGQTFTFVSRTGSGDNLVETTNPSIRSPYINNHNARLGLDYELGVGTTAGLLVSGYNNNWNMDATSNILIEPALGIDTLIANTVFEENNWRNWQLNANLTQQLGTEGQLEVNYDYLWFRNENPIDYFYGYSDSAGQPFFDFDLLSQKITPFSIHVLRLDYRTQLDSKWSLETGVKGAFSAFENQVRVERDEISLTEFNSLANLQENVWAAYGQTEYALSEKVQFKAGLRYEYATSDLQTVEEGQVVDRKRGRLFPSVFAQFGKVNLSYNRRVNRPAFTDMAPFLIFLDPQSNFGGNPALRPSISDNFQLTYQLGVINISGQYTFENDPIFRFQNRYDPATRRQIIQPDNIESQRTYNLSLGFPIKFTEWWQSRWSAFSIWQEINTNDEAGLQTNNNQFTRFNGNFSFSLPKQWTIELSGFYQTRNLNGNVAIQATGMLNFGLQKQLPNGARISFNVNDVFDSFVFSGITDIPELDLFIERSFDFSNRVFRLSYSASFGDSQVRRNRNRQGPEEAGRVN